MKIKDKIVQTLASMTAELLEIGPDFYIIGASAMILSDIEIGETSDIDILTTEMNSLKLQCSLKAYMEIAPETKEDGLFSSNFARFNLPLMDVEVMGNLQIKKNNVWQVTPAPRHIAATYRHRPPRRAPTAPTRAAPPAPTPRLSRTVPRC